MSSTDTSSIQLENARLIQSLVSTEGALQAPINLDISTMKVIELSPLKWFHIDLAARKLKMTNTGYTVIISAKWQQTRPYICGGPFTDDYIFSQIHFHWGENEMYGSEHYIDGGSMPMELHVVHFKSDYDSLDAALRRADGVTIVVYLFKAEPNVYMEEIVNKLSVIRTAQSSVRLTPAHLTNLVRPFSEDYFLYWGSVLTGEQVHSILWIVSRVPIGISIEQIAEFRTLHDNRNLPLVSNVRPLKERQNRNTFYVCPAGSTYASLLPVPRDFSSLEGNQSHH